MQTTSFETRLQQRLLRMAAAGGILRELACVFAGLALMTGLLTRPMHPGAPSSVALSGATLILLVVLLLAGPVLNLLRPVFWAMGLLPGWCLGALVGGLVVFKLRQAGARYLAWPGHPLLPKD